MAEVRAEIAANVWQVLVEPGAAVDEGDELVILESMKMEIPVAGTVERHRQRGAGQAGGPGAGGRRPRRARLIAAAAASSGRAPDLRRGIHDSGTSRH